MPDKRIVTKAIRALEEVGASARVFVSMPIVKGITPRVFVDSSASETAQTREPFTRLHGIFALDEAGLSFLDHAALYGDACFEGILIRNGMVFLYREHMDRFWNSAAGLRIEIPYSKEEMSWQVMRTIQAVGLKKNESGYIRLIVTRGIGDLGLNPKKCVGATVYAVVSTISLYPKEAYDIGIEVGVSKKIRRPGATILDPTIKSNNYLNNVLGLIEGTRNLELLESLMLTADGSIAEATVDNVFSVIKESGYRTNPSRVRVLTPVAEYCLQGITRACIMNFARKFGYKVEEAADLMPIDLLGANRECFMTGTGAGIMPIVKVCGNSVGDGRPGYITKKLLAEIRKAMANPAFGLSISADRGQVYRYIRSNKCPVRI
ncbi:MAG: aminotransferase class IV [Candidatus Eisenbacteria bacterium]|nr:aminotransferase class IV [Candidatus Eisenbacteria bacterium]